MNKILQGTIIGGILVAGFVSVWALVWIPYKQTRDFETCLADSAATLERKNAEIRAHIEDLEQQKTTAQQQADTKLAEFLKENPEPKKRSAVECSGRKDFSQQFTCIDNGFSDWNNMQYELFDEVRNLDGQIENIQSDFEKVEKEKAENDEVCYKKFK